MYIALERRKILKDMHLRKGWKEGQGREGNIEDVAVTERAQPGAIRDPSVRFRLPREGKEPRE